MAAEWARIDGGIVVELTTVNPAGRFNAAMVWVACDGTPGVAQGWSYGGTPPAFAAPAVPAPTLAARQAAAVAAIGAQVAALLAAGAPYGGKLIEADVNARADLGGMATTAGLVLSGALTTWPAAYSQGWITADGSLLALPTPAAGIALAAAVGVWYAQLVQTAQAACTAAAAAADPEAVVAATNLTAAAAATATTTTSAATAAAAAASG